MSTFKLETIQENLLKPILERKKLVDTLICKLNEELKNAPLEHLQVSKNKNTYQYYYKTQFSSKKGIYIPQRNLSKAQKIAQRDYNSKLLKKLLVEQKALNKIISIFKFTDIFNAFDSLHPARKKLVTPVIMSPAEFAEQWQSKSYKNTAYHKENQIFRTNNNEYVRSKSELLIANTLSLNKIPYKYERKCTLKNGKTYYPDFYCLNKRTRQEFLWEHFGLLQSPEYATAAVDKFLTYTQNGFQQGRNIIYTAETQTTPLTPNTIQKIIDAYLK